jgi:predicted RNA-binding Zn-ribbon protein involved in translation (DUF1610 family)
MDFLEPTKEEIQKAGRYIDHLEKQYQKNHPCPKCGSYNVHIDIDGLGGGYVYGSEWCDDCGWKEITDTFPKGGI